MNNRIERRRIRLDGGRAITLLVNLDSGLIVLDLLDADERGGVELLRLYATKREPSVKPGCCCGRSHE